MRTPIFASLVSAFGLFVVAGCTGPNPEFTGYAPSVADAGTDGGANPDASSVMCPRYLAKTQGFAFHPDTVNCRNWVSLPADGQASSDMTGTWQQFSPQLEVRYVYQQFTGAASDTWTVQPGSVRSDHNANTWQVFDKNTTSITPTLAQNGMVIGLTRLRVDYQNRLVVTEHCPGTNGTCQLWQ